MPELSETLPPRLDVLRPFVERTAVGDFSRSRLFSSCLKSSFVRTFEYVDSVSKESPDQAFFLIPALRGITEDIIYFVFLSDFAPETRERVIENMMHLEVHRSITDQYQFFRTFRPFQPVLSATVPNIEAVKEELRTFWRGNGWPNLRQESPPTREIAEKTIPGILEQVYDFVYRLTSGAVHFNPKLLLKLGWGVMGADEGVVENSKFSSKHMGAYHLAVCQIFGCYLLCLYFELFEELLQPKQEEMTAVTELRDHIWRGYRWPEMITFDEMNMAAPEPEAGKWHILVCALYSTVMKEGFVSGAKHILGDRDSQRPKSVGEAS